MLISFYPTTHPPGLVVKLQLEPLHQLQLQLYHLAQLELGPAQPQLVYNILPNNHIFTEYFLVLEIENTALDKEEAGIK